MPRGCRVSVSRLMSLCQICTNSSYILSAIIHKVAERCAEIIAVTWVASDLKERLVPH